MPNNNDKNAVAVATTTTTTTEEDNYYDLLLFGATGFTGQLAVEYLLKKQRQMQKDAGGSSSKKKSFMWAACARNRPKAEAVVRAIVDRLNAEEEDQEGSSYKYEPPPIVVAELVCDTDEQLAGLRSVVSHTKVALTCAGPFELYGKALVKLCATLGVDYADITGETDFVRSTIAEHDATARSTPTARIVCHCGNDCIPQDLVVYEMHRYAQQQYNAGGQAGQEQREVELVKVQTCVEFGASAAWSGGTVATATYQLSKDRTGSGGGGEGGDGGGSKERPPFDPLLMTQDGEKSQFLTKNASPKRATTVEEFGGEGGAGVGVEPWIMGPVMVNCVRRSNALLQYSKQFEYGDMILSREGWAWFSAKASEAVMGAALMLPASVSRYLVPKAGDGPARDDMERGWMTLRASGTVVVGGCGDSSDSDKKETKKITAKFHFNKDIAYLYTAALLVETGLLMLETRAGGDADDRKGGGGGGVLTPAAAFGSQLTKRILDNLDASLEIKEAAGGEDQ